MYAPVALRFQTYAVTVDGAAGAYAQMLLGLPAMQEWVAAARNESERLPHYEPADA
jgi:glutathione S-transferase